MEAFGRSGPIDAGTGLLLMLAFTHAQGRLRHLVGHRGSVQPALRRSPRPAHGRPAILHSQHPGLETWQSLPGAPSPPGVSLRTCSTTCNMNMQQQADCRILPVF